ncbi:MAG: hypothetical protein FRX49_09373 [Trebouxia sp. A1-2]|nr:MAG: hypothetical protein FRX49_09373 [Trebouxia sp. A1-2]
MAQEGSATYHICSKRITKAGQADVTRLSCSKKRPAGFSSVAGMYFDLLVSNLSDHDPYNNPAAQSQQAK